MGKKKGKRKGRKKKKKKKKKKAAKCPPIDTTVKLAPLDVCPPKKPCESDFFDDLITVQPNHYPGFMKHAAVMVVAGSEDGSYESLCKLVRAGLRCAERVFVMTPWANYVIFRARSKDGLIYFIFDGCTCDVNIFRYMDLSCGTAGFIHFTNLDEAIRYFIHSRAVKMQFKDITRVSVNDIVDDYGSCQYKTAAKCRRIC